MLIVIPISSHDSKLLEPFCGVLNFFGPYNGHDLLVVSRPSDKEYAKLLFDSIKQNFDSFNIFTFSEDGPTGWPEGPNFYWYNTIKYLKENDNKKPWYWMELDCTPIGFGWIDALNKEYDECGAYCLGIIQELSELTSEHLVGVAVYPPRLDKKCKCWKYCNVLNIAFDVLCNSEIVPISKNSKIMQHNFRTEEYRCTNDGIKGIEKDFRLDDLRFDKYIRDDAFIVHGCIDGSLANLILNEEIVPKKFLNE